jgi:tetratricopeptide (TPR) repeat protein
VACLGAAALTVAAWCAAGVPVSDAGDPLVELRAALEAGDLPQATRAGEAAVAADPKSSEAQDLLGRAYGLTAQQSQLLEQMRLARKARACFARAVQLDPANVAALSDLARYDMRAPALLGGGKKKARETIERVLALDGERGHVLLGELAERGRNWDEAEAEYRRAIAAAPRSDRGRLALSALLAARKEYGKARSVWTEVREGDPSSTLPDYELAGIALASGDELLAARRDLEGALTRAAGPEGPSPAALHERLALVYEKLGKKREAAAELEAALLLEPDRADWRRQLARLEK